VNKKLVLSVLSTAVVASMASAAMAKPNAGFYVGGEVDKYYSIDAFLGDHFDDALDAILSELGDTVFVDDKANAAPFVEALDANTSEDLSKIMKPATKAIFGDNVYTNVEDPTAKPYNPAEDTDLEPGTPVGDLVVESVSAISNTTVDVAIAAPQEDILGVTVEVKDNKGNIVEVNPTDISAGDTVASFTFKTPVEKLEGVWTVAGKEYSFTAIQQLADITDAASADPLDEVKLLNALNAAGIKNVDENKLAAYADAVVDAAPATLADVQTAIDKANKSAVDKDDEAAAVKAVVDAANQIQLLNALKANFAFVNADWAVKYAAAEVTNDGGANVTLIGLTKDNSDGVTFEAIQEAINDTNDVEVAAAYDKAFKSLKTADVTAARTLANTYLSTDEDAPFTKKEVSNDSLDVLDALIRVNAATTNNSLKNALVALSNLEKALVEKYKNVPGAITAEFDIKLVNDNYLADYRKAISDEKDVTKKNQRKDIEAIIKKVNADNASSQIGKVNGATTPEELLKALKAYPGLKQVADINKDSYAANTDFASVDADDIQAAVDASNLDAVKTATVANIIAKLNVFGLDNVVAANAAKYEAAKATLGGVSVGSTNADTVKNLKAAVKLVNEAVTENAEVEAINKAETASQVKDALDKLAIAGYLNVPSADRLYVANALLEVRGKSTFADLDEVKEALVNAAGDEGVLVDYEEALKGVNDLKADSSITATVAALKKVGNEGFNKLGATQQSIVAENFLNSLTFDADNGKLKPLFKTLAAVNTALDAVK